MVRCQSFVQHISLDFGLEIFGCGILHIVLGGIYTGLPFFNALEGVLILGI